MKTKEDATRIAKEVWDRLAVTMFLEGQTMRPAFLEEQVSRLTEEMMADLGHVNWGYFKDKVRMENWFCPNCGRETPLVAPSDREDRKRILDCRPCGWEFDINLHRYLGQRPT